MSARSSDCKVTIPVPTLRRQATSTKIAYAKHLVEGVIQDVAIGLVWRGISHYVVEPNAYVVYSLPEDLARDNLVSYCLTEIRSLRPPCKGTCICCGSSDFNCFEVEGLSAKPDTIRKVVVICCCSRM